MQNTNRIIDTGELILITGATGFLGSRVVPALAHLGFKNIRCLVRPSSNTGQLEQIGREHGGQIDILRGNLLSREDCERATRGVSLIYHLAAGTGSKSFADTFLNSVVATRNLLDAALGNANVRRFVNVSSFAVYSNEGNPRPGVLDEDSPVEPHPETLHDPYAFAKISQDELIADYGRKHGIRYVLVRPGVVYGRGKERIHGRVGMDTFGVFVHLGGSNRIPLTFVDNCAEAIALAGIQEGVDGQVFNVVDDNLPSSREFLKQYKQEVRSFPSFAIPHSVSYLFCLLWEKYSEWSKGQLPSVYNRKAWRTTWKPTEYSNAKIKNMLGWTPRVSTAEGLRLFFASCREKLNRA